MDHLLTGDSIAFCLFGMAQGVGSETFEFLTEGLHKAVSYATLAAGVLLYYSAQKVAAPRSTTYFRGRKVELHLPPVGRPPAFPGGFGRAAGDLLWAMVAFTIGVLIGLLASYARSQLRPTKTAPQIEHSSPEKVPE
jgi:hypothetical protein